MCLLLRRNRYARVCDRGRSATFVRAICSVSTSKGSSLRNGDRFFQREYYYTRHDTHRERIATYIYKRDSLVPSSNAWCVCVRAPPCVRAPCVLLAACNWQFPFFNALCTLPRYPWQPPSTRPRDDDCQTATVRRRCRRHNI